MKYILQILSASFQLPELQDVTNDVCTEINIHAGDKIHSCMDEFWDQITQIISETIRSRLSVLVIGILND